MSDLMCIAVLLACCAATGGLVVLCERLMPRGEGPGNQGQQESEP